MLTKRSLQKPKFFTPHRNNFSPTSEKVSRCGVAKKIQSHITNLSTLAIMSSADTDNNIVVRDESTYITFCRTLGHLKLTGNHEEFFSCELLWQGV